MLSQPAPPSGWGKLNCSTCKWPSPSVARAVLVYPGAEAYLSPSHAVLLSLTLDQPATADVRRSGELYPVTRRCSDNP